MSGHERSRREDPGSGGPRRDGSTASDKAPRSSRGKKPSLRPDRTTHVVRLQREAGNRAVVGLLTRGSTAGPTAGRALSLQLQPTPAPGLSQVPFRGEVLLPEPAYLRALLERLVQKNGQSETESFAYAFLRMPVEDKASLTLRGVQPGLVERVQKALEPELEELQKEQKAYVEQFGAAVLKDTQDVLAASKEQLEIERRKYAGEPGAPEPDVGVLRQAAKQLAAKRKAADEAAATAAKAREEMVKDTAPKAEFASPFPAPQFPVFRNPTLRKRAGETNDAWFKLEQEYGSLRVEKEKAFPALAMYASNEDGGAAARLDDLPTWGPWKDSRQRTVILAEVHRRLRSVEDAKDGLDESRAWQLSRMVELTLKKREAKPYQQRWVHDAAAKLAMAEAERQQLIATIAIAIAVVAAVATAGAALAAEGTAAAAGASLVASGAQIVSTGLTIATAYKDLDDYHFQKAATESALDKANAIAEGDPSLLAVAFDLVAVGLELAAAKAAFQAIGPAVKTLRGGSELGASLAAIEKGAPAAAGKIIPRVLAEAQAAGTLERAIAAEGAKFKGSDLAKVHSLIEFHLGERFADAYVSMASRGKILPLTEEGLEAALSHVAPRDPAFTSRAEELISKGTLRFNGLYDDVSNTIFVRPGAEGKFSTIVVHELTHAMQIKEGVRFNSFLVEFEAYAVERKLSNKLRLYGYQGDLPWANATDWDIAKHIKEAYGFPVPPWAVENPTKAWSLESKAISVMVRIRSF